MLLTTKTGGEMRQPVLGDRVLYTSNPHVKPYITEVARTENGSVEPYIVINFSMYCTTELITSLIWDEISGHWVSRLAQFYPKKNAH